MRMRPPPHEDGSLGHKYSNKLWSIVSQGMFQLREINQMEREMRQYLEWGLHLNPAALKQFTRTFLFLFLFGESPHPPSAAI